MIFFLDYFLNKGEGGGGSVYLKLMVVVVFGHEIHIFIPKFGQNSHFIPKCVCVWGGVHRAAKKSPCFVFTFQMIIWHLVTKI